LEKKKTQYRPSGQLMSPTPTGVTPFVEGRWRTEKKTKNRVKGKKRLTWSIQVDSIVFDLLRRLLLPDGPAPGAHKGRKKKKEKKKQGEPTSVDFGEERFLGAVGHRGS